MTSMKNDFFGVILCLSVGMHAGAAVFFHATFEPPTPLPLRSGYVSIDLRASVASAPKTKPVPVKKTLAQERPPEKLPAPERALEPKKVRAPEVLPAPTQVAAALPQPERLPEPLPLPQRVVETLPMPEAVKEKPAPKSRQDSVASEASVGSKANLGAITPPRGFESNPVPPYPRSELLAGHEGKVTLFVRIDPTGRIVSVRVEKSSGWPGLDLAAVTSAYLHRFEPARQNGVPVMYESPYEFHFSIERWLRSQR